MPHKYTREDTIRRSEAEIASYEASIRLARTISLGGNDGFNALKEMVRSFMENARDKKNNALDFLARTEDEKLFPGETQEKIAILCRGQEKAFEIILDLMENPQVSVPYYENEKKDAEERLKRYKSYEQRPSEPAA